MLGCSEMIWPGSAQPTARRSIERGRNAGALCGQFAHQPLRCTTSSKGRRFNRVPGLSGRSTG